MSEAPEATEGLVVSIEVLLQRLPANEAAILRLRVLEGQSRSWCKRQRGRATGPHQPQPSIRPAGGRPHPQPGTVMRSCGGRISR